MPGDSNMDAGRKAGKGFLIKGLFVLVVAGIAIGVAVFFVKSRPRAAKKAREKVATLVEVQPLHMSEETIELTAMGTVIPAQEVQLQAEVSGLITYVNPMLVAGGVVTNDEILLKIDNRTYQAQLKIKQAALAMARSQMKLEEGQQDIAQADWEYMQLMTNMDERDRSFAMREPQLASAQAAEESAQAAVDEARYQFERTVIRAPFDAVVQSIYTEVGERAAPGSTLADLIGAEVYYIRAALPVRELGWLKYSDADSKGSPVAVIMENGTTREGYVLYRLPDLEPQARMARILVRVADPLGLKTAVEPLLLYDYLSMRITGDTVSDVCRIPRPALRNGKEIWLKQKDNTLRILPVEVVRGNTDSVLIRGQWSPDSLLIVSDLATPVEGMMLTESQSLTDNTPKRETP